MKFAPLKNGNWVKEIPEHIIYLRRVNEIYHPEQLEYVMFSTKKNCTAELFCHKPKIPLRDDGKPALAIDFLHSAMQNSGCGKAFINFAIKLSEQLGCEGNLILKSSSMFTPERAPHIFYRKCGFTTCDAKMDKKLDKFIKKHKNGKEKDFPDKLMYYTMSEQITQPEKSNNLLSCFCRKILSYLGL